MTDLLLKKWLEDNGGWTQLTPSQRKQPEAPHYPPTKEFMEVLLRDSGCETVHLEITGTNSFSPELKDAFGEVLILLDKSYSPDISGTYEKEGKKIIIVEVKPDEMKMRDIYQTLEYFELVNAEIGILITPKKIPVRIQNYLDQNEELLTRCGRNIFIGTISMKEKKFISEEWYPRHPTF